MHIEPEKQLAILKGIRIHSDYRHRRIYGPMLAKGVLSYLSENFPIVQRIVTSTEAKTKEAYSQKTYIPGKWKEIYRSVSVQQLVPRNLQYFSTGILLCPNLK